MRFYVKTFFFLFLVSCATPRVQKESQQLQNRITSLEKELKQKDERIKLLEEELKEKELTEGKKTTLTITPKRIQLALRNAGFYKGSIDGKIGSQTKEAIKACQKANDLKPDGIVGKRTWEKLSKYLSE